jgi:anaerobic ribonucleoside-triphosphate reductase activating protein
VSTLPPETLPPEEETRLRVHDFLPSSKANGPGERAVLWVQGCSLGCAGCFNPETHRRAGGTAVPVGELVERLDRLAPNVEGLTMSGGEPFQQRRPVQQLLRRVRARTALSVLVFTGYAWGEVQRMPGVEDMLSHVDVLVAGRYDAEQRVAGQLRGSANQTVHFLSDRYAQPDVREVPQAEVVIDPDGEVTLSGIDPLEW